MKQMRTKQFVAWYVETEQGLKYWDVKHTAWNLHQVSAYVKRLVMKDCEQDLKRTIVKVIDETTYNECKENVLYMPFTRLETL